MGLVLIITGGAVLVLRAYNMARSSEALAVLLPTLRQQAAVVATLAGMVFALLEALEKGKVITSLLAGGGSAGGSSGGSYGGPVGPRGLAEAAVAGVIATG